MNTPAPSRRNFLKASTALGLFQIVPGHVVGANGQTPPSEKLNVAGIGVGGMGHRDIGHFRGENVVALCDVDHKYAARTFKQFPSATLYRDYREMLEKEKNLDAVVISTPDHTHAVISAAAMRAGKHVYCQKPLTHNIAEARALARLAAEAGVCTQMGIQNHALEGIRLAREWIEAGVIGAVAEVTAWCSLTYEPAGHAYWSPPVLRRPTETPPVPAELDWDLWIGPAPMRPYHRAYHPGCWRAWWDFGCGMMGDRGVHTLDSIVWSLQLGLPTQIEVESDAINEDTHPRRAKVIFHFPARGKLPPVKVTWLEGQEPPRPADLEPGRQMGDPEGGILFFGSKGTLMANYTCTSPRLIPEQKMKDFTERPPKTLPRVPGSHYAEFISACKGDRKTGAPFSYGALLTEICHLGNVAKRAQQTIEWDAANMRVTNHEAANAFVQRPYRDGWKL